MAFVGRLGLFRGVAWAVAVGTRAITAPECTVADMIQSGVILQPQVGPYKERLALSINSWQLATALSSTAAREAE